MLFFGDSNSKELSESIGKKLGVRVHYPEITVFPDGERRVHLLENVVDKDVVFLTTVGTSLDTYVLETSFLIDACKRSGASSVTGIIPYMPYSRADHVFRDGEAVPLEVVIHILESAGLSKILFVDPHTIKMPEMFTIEVKDLSALPVFAEKIREIGFDKENSVIVSPDMGGLRRMEQLSEMLNNLPFASVEKERDYDDGSITASGIHGEIKSTCFVVDDIISSGRTIVQAVEKITALGAKNIYVFATHPILSEDASKILQKCKAIKIYVTDAIPVPEVKKFPKLEVLCLDQILAKGLQE
jgi:ribose-phosphate pyrophosphokinase